MSKTFYEWINQSENWKIILKSFYDYKNFFEECEGSKNSLKGSKEQLYSVTINFVFSKRTEVSII